MIVLRRDLAHHPAIRRLLPSVHRSLSRPKQRGFNVALVRSLKDVEVRTPAGVILGQAKGYNVDLDRMCRVMERVAVGFYFDHAKAKLPGNHVCRVYPLDGIEEAEFRPGTGLREVIDFARAGERRVWGNDVFTRWFNAATTPDGATASIFLLFGVAGFIAFTAPLASEK
mgnify:FL=1